MANHRMFSYRIANSAKFLQMPAESQLLYFHMVLRADDDGVVESYPLTKMLGLAPDNFKVLLAKGFIQQLNEDQVIIIVDWLEHNTIRADRKVNSIYFDLIKNKLPELSLIEPKPRADTGKPTGQPMDVHSPRKLSKGKLSKGNTPSGEGKEINEVISLFKEVNPLIEKLYGRTSERKAVERLLKVYGRQKLEEMIKSLPVLNGQKYWPKSTTPIQLENNVAIYQAKKSELETKQAERKIKPVILK